jgi:CspA family cold shock protein
LRFLTEFKCGSHQRCTSLQGRIPTGVEEEGGEKVLDQARARIGRIKYWYCGKRGYGFIQPEEGGEVVFVHHTCIAPHAKGKSLKEGARVTYEVTREKMAGLWARNVCIAD